MDATVQQEPAGDLPASYEAAQACPGANTLTVDEVQRVFVQVRQRFARTEFTAAWAACAPGLIALRLANDEVAYTDKSGRYLILGLVLDSATGRALDRQLDPLETERP